MNNKSSILVKMIAFSIAFLSVAMLILSYVINSAATEIVEKNTADHLASVNQEKAKQLEIIFQNLIKSSENLSSSPLFDSIQNIEGNQNLGPMRAYLSDLKTSSNGIYENIFIEKNQKILVDGLHGKSEGFPLDYSTFPGYVKVRQTGKPILTNPQISPVSGRRVFMLLAPIKSHSSQQVIGVLAAAIDLNSMAEAAISSSSGKQSDGIASYLIDKSGLVLLSSDSDAILSLNFSENTGSTDLFNHIKRSDNGNGDMVLNGGNNIAYFQHIPVSGLTLINTRPVNEYMQQIEALENYLIITMTIGTIVCALLLSLFFYAITRPLLQRLFIAMSSAEQIAQNNLTTDIPVTGNDEGSRLLTALNKMQNDLTHTIKVIMSSSGQLSTTATTLSSEASEAEDKIDEQNHELQNAATAISQLRVACDSVAVNASTVAQSSLSGTEHAKTGRTSVNDTSHAIQELTNDLKFTSESVHALASQIGDMTSILDVIRDVADQTNLLALNAAIESARAGEAGRGFAVVADEVRMLAQRTADSTSKIGNMMFAIDDKGKKVVANLSSINQKAMNTLEIAQQADQALVEIETAMDRINEENLIIASATEEQSQVVQEIETNLGNIKQGSQVVYDKVHATTNASRELNQLAQDLNTRIDMFTV